MVEPFQKFMNRKFEENKRRIREILVEREKRYPDRKTLTIGLYGGITTAIQYSLILTQYGEILSAGPQ
jgi:hypothetical protein